MEDLAYRRHDLVAECEEGHDQQSRQKGACGEFLGKALALAVRARRLHCSGLDLRAPRWSTDEQVQLRVCQALQSPARLREELRRRERLLSGCSCNRFARRAVSLSRQARRKNCRYRGARWSTSIKVQERNCRALPVASRNRELKKLAALVSRCGNTGGGGRSSSATCVDYARRAVVLTRKARANNCPYRGRRWSVKKRKQRAWCKGRSLAELNREQAARRRLLAKCLRDRERMFNY